MRQDLDEKTALDLGLKSDAELLSEVEALGCDFSLDDPEAQGSDDAVLALLEGR